MRITSLLLPAALAAGTAYLLLPVEPARGFSVLGGSLGLAQRDFRIFNNFTDAGANNNVTPDPQFPGYDGAEMAIWKAVIEWGSELHGNGNGDPTQVGGLGSGGANFDSSFQGNAVGIGGTNDNIFSELAGSDGGTLAFCEAPISDGWRIRFYSNWTWADGPGSIPFGQFDIQGIACHEYGHALGLDHSADGAATMTPGAVGTGVGQRSINPDDQAGVQFIYGVKSAGKPRITNAVLSGSDVVITGTNFSATNNEVWFTQNGAAGDGTPVKITGVTSNGTTITVTPPGAAGKGDVLVRNNGTGNANLSNAWPLDPGTGSSVLTPVISGLTPGSIPALSPDGQIMTVSGDNFVGTSSVLLAGVAQTFTVVDDSTLTFPIPLQNLLGPVTLQITNSFGSNFVQVEIDACDPPVIDLKDSVPFSLLTVLGLSITVASEPGDIVYVAVSAFPTPSVLPGVVALDIGAGFSNVIQLGSKIIPAKGWASLPTIPFNVPPGTQLYFQAAALTTSPLGLPLQASNVQQGSVLF